MLVGKSSSSLSFVVLALTIMITLPQHATEATSVIRIPSDESRTTTGGLFDAVLDSKDVEHQQGENFQFFQRRNIMMTTSMPPKPCEGPVVKLILWDADHDVPLGPLDSDGMIYRCEYKHTKLTIQAVKGVEGCGEDFKKVVFKMYVMGTGKHTRTTIETLPPFMLGGEYFESGDILPVWQLKSRGSYTLDVKPEPGYETETFPIHVGGWYDGCEEYVYDG